MNRPATIGWATALLDEDSVQRAELPSGCTLAEALDLTDLHTGYPLMVMMRPANDAPALIYARAEWGVTVVPDGAIVAALTMPQGKQGSRIAAMLALIIAAAIIAPGIGGSVAGALGITGTNAAAIGTSLAFSAINLVGTALINWLLPPPTSKSPGKQADVSPTYSLSAQGNYARLGQAIPEHFGYHIHYLDVVAGYSEWPGGQQLLYLGYCLGEGEYEIHEFGFDRTPAWRAEQWNLIGRNDWSDFTDAEVQDATGPWGLSDWEITLTGDGSDASAAVPARALASGEAHTLSFIAWSEDGPVTLAADLTEGTLPDESFAVTPEPQAFTWTFSSAHADMATAAPRFLSVALASGEVIHIKDVQMAQRAYAPPFMDRAANHVAGATTSFGFGWEVVPPGGAPGAFNDAVLTVADVTGQTLLGTNEDGADWVGPFPLNPPGTEAIGWSNDWAWASGLFEQNISSGGYDAATAEVELQMQAIDDIGLPLGAWFTVAAESVTDRTGPRGRRSTSRGVFVTPGRFQARARRTNESPDDNTIVDTTSWAGLRAIFAPTEAIGSESWLLIRAAAQQNLQGSAASKFYVIATRKLPVLEDGEWSEDLRPTRCIGAAIGEVHRKTWPGGGLDIEGLESLCQTWAIRGDTFNGIFDTARSAWDALSAIARTGRARPILPGGTLAIVRDEPRSISTLALMPSNVLPNSASVDYILANDDLADGLIVEYLDERTWRKGLVRCALPGVTPVNIKRIEGAFLTNRAHVWREHMFALGQNQWRRIFAECETEMEGLMLWPGHRVDFGHDAVNWGFHANVAAFDFTGDDKRVILDRPMPWEDGETHRLSLSRKSGRVWGPVTVTRESATICILPDPLPGGLELPGAEFVTKATSNGRVEPARAQFGWGTVFARPMLVGKSVPRAGNRARVSLAIDDPRVHTADAGMPPAEPGPLAPPDAEDLDYTVAGVVTGSGDTRTVAVTLSGYSADLRFVEYEIGGFAYGLDFAAHTFTGVPAAEAGSGRVRAWGRWSIGDWVDWTA